MICAITLLCGRCFDLDLGRCTSSAHLNPQKLCNSINFDSCDFDTFAKTPYAVILAKKFAEFKAKVRASGLHACSLCCIWRSCIFITPHLIRRPRFSVSLNQSEGRAPNWKEQKTLQMEYVESSL